MGKPFASELSFLPATIKWSQRYKVDTIRRFFQNAEGQPLYAVGVGGSFTAASFAALLQNRQGNPAVALTTFEFCTRGVNLRNGHVVLFTGGGNNRDILSAFDWALKNEARSVLVICASVGSAIGMRVKRYWHAEIAEFRLPTGRDGFLATNSLLAMCVLLARAFGANPRDFAMPEITPSIIEKSVRSLVEERRNEFIVLAGGYGMPAGIDLESKCSEAALANIMLNDYRHFAHGRHLWLVKRPQTTAVIGIVTRGEIEIFTKTSMLIPPDIPIIQLQALHKDPVSTISLLHQVFYFVGALGKAIGQDPGRPGVPEFGRRLYHLGMQRGSQLRASHESVEEIACERKRWIGGTYRDWHQEFRQFVQSLQKTVFSTLIFDFDGTLCGARDRFSGVSEILHRPLMRLLRSGVQFGIATGRGDSCREALRRIIPRRFWNRVIVGYHNGSDIGTLGDATVPKPDEPPIEAIAKLMAGLKRCRLAKHCDFRVHRCQLTAKPETPKYAKIIGQTVEELIDRDCLPLRMVHSSHSFDILGCEASKINVLKYSISRGEKALCIGDRGAWPGNDFELLCTEHSLSVDEVSSNPHTCWNIAPAGVRCEQATLFYLAGMEATRGALNFSLGRSLSWFRKSLS